jgi:hypothetical protein
MERHEGPQSRNSVHGHGSIPGPPAFESGVTASPSRLLLILRTPTRSATVFAAGAQNATKSRNRSSLSKQLPD